MVALRRRLAHLSYAGLAYQARGAAMTLDSIVRIYSMTKSLTSVAAMMLYEQLFFQIDGNHPLPALLSRYARVHRRQIGGSSPACPPTATSSSATR